MRASHAVGSAPELLVTMASCSVGSGGDGGGGGGGMCVGGVYASGAFAFLPAGRGAYHECGAVFDERIHACRHDAKLGGETRKRTVREDRKLKGTLCQNLRRS